MARKTRGNRVIGRRDTAQFLALLRDPVTTGYYWKVNVAQKSKFTSESAVVPPLREMSGTVDWMPRQFLPDSVAPVADKVVFPENSLLGSSRVSLTDV